MLSLLWRAEKPPIDSGLKIKKVLKLATKDKEQSPNVTFKIK